MGGIFNLLSLQNEEISSHVLEALIEISRINYSMMGEYI